MQCHSPRRAPSLLCLICLLSTGDALLIGLTSGLRIDAGGPNLVILRVATRAMVKRGARAR